MSHFRTALCPFEERGRRGALCPQRRAMRTRLRSGRQFHGFAVYKPAVMGNTLYTQRARLKTAQRPCENCLSLELGLDVINIWGEALSTPPLFGRVVVDSIGVLQPFRVDFTVESFVIRIYYRPVRGGAGFVDGHMAARRSKHLPCVAAIYRESCVLTGESYFFIVYGTEQFTRNSRVMYLRNIESGLPKGTTTCLASTFDRIDLERLDHKRPSCLCIRKSSSQIQRDSIHCHYFMLRYIGLMRKRQRPRVKPWFLLDNPRSHIFEFLTVFRPACLAHAQPQQSAAHTVQNESWLYIVGHLLAHPRQATTTLSIMKRLYVLFCPVLLAFPPPDLVVPFCLKQLPVK